MLMFLWQALNTIFFVFMTEHNVEHLFPTSSIQTTTNSVSGFCFRIEFAYVNVKTNVNT